MIQSNNWVFTVSGPIKPSKFCKLIYNYESITEFLSYSKYAKLQHQISPIPK